MAVSQKLKVELLDAPENCIPRCISKKQKPKTPILKDTQWRKDSLFKVVLGKPDSYMQKNVIRTCSHTIYKNKFEMD